MNNETAIKTQIVNFLPATQGKLGWHIRCNSTFTYDQNLHSLTLRACIDELKEAGVVKCAGFGACGSVLYDNA